MAQATSVLFVELNRDGTIGGSYNSLLDIVRNIDEDKIAPHVAFYSKHELSSKFESIAKVYYMPTTFAVVFARLLPQEVVKLPGVKQVLQFLQRALNLIFSSGSELLSAVSIVRQSKAAVVHLNNAPSRWIWYFAAKLNGASCTAHLRGEYRPSPLKAFLARRFDKIIAISSFISRQFQEGGEYSNVSVLLNGIDEQEFLQGIADSTVPSEVDTSRFVAVLVGNLRPWKGQHVALRAWAQLENFLKTQLILVGEATDDEAGEAYIRELKNLVEENGLEGSVVFTGYRANVGEYMNAADVVVHTSIEPEPLGRVILEAGALGKPVIATNHGGPLELIVDGQTGILVSAGDDEALASAIDRLRCNPQLGLQMGRSAKQRIATRHSIDSYCVKLTDLLLP